MTTPAQSPVQQPPAVFFPGASPPDLNPETVLFTVPGNAPARIESVYAQAIYSTASIDEFWVLRIYDISGTCLFVASTGMVSED